jgi:hypothetical protein
MRTGISQNPNIHVFPKEMVTTLTSSVSAILSLVVLFTPVVAMLFIQPLAARVGVVVAACTAFIFILSIFARAKTSELFIAGATFVRTYTL